MRNVLTILPRDAAEAMELADEADEFGLDSIAEAFRLEALRLKNEAGGRDILIDLHGPHYFEGSTNVH